MFCVSVFTVAGPLVGAVEHVDDGLLDLSLEVRNDVDEALRTRLFLLEFLDARAGGARREEETSGLRTGLEV